MPKIDIIMSTGALSKALNISQTTLRTYDREGILSPQRTTTNRRCYNLNDFEKAKLVTFLTRNLALNLSGVKLIISLLEKSNIQPTDYIKYVNDAANLARIDIKVQMDNIKKTRRRGRKKIL